MRLANATMPPCITLGWAKYPGNVGTRMNAKVMHKLHQLYIRGKEQKKRKVSADRALQIVRDEIIYADWNQQLDVTIPKIKAFFSMTPAKQTKLLEEALENAEATPLLNQFDDSVQLTELKGIESEKQYVAMNLLDVADV